MIRCVCFDFDGTLVDSNTMKREAYSVIFAHLGDTRDLVNETLEANRDGDRYQVVEAVIRRLIAAGLLPSTASAYDLTQHYAAQYGLLCEEHAATCPEMPGAGRTLARLSGAYSLYINSGTPEPQLNQVVFRRGWAHLFRGVFGRPNTKTENLARITLQEEVEKDQIVFVGDDMQDLESADAFGCGFIGVISPTSCFHRNLRLAVTCLSDLEQAIQELNT
jgi:phosphoglycolate phosphatase-like HAD superfamily hydrolase